MSTIKTLSIFAAILLFSIIAINNVSAFDHTNFNQLSDSIIYRENISGGDRGFSLRRSSDVSRQTIYGHYDWSYNPRNVRYSNSNSDRISDRLVLEAFKTFQQDSKDRTQLERDRERNRNRYPHYGSRYGGYNYGYGGYSRVNYGYNSFYGYY